MIFMQRSTLQNTFAKFTKHRKNSMNCTLSWEQLSQPGQQSQVENKHVVHLQALLLTCPCIPTRHSSTITPIISTLIQLRSSMHRGLRPNTILHSRYGSSKLTRTENGLQLKRCSPAKNTSTHILPSTQRTICIPKSCQAFLQRHRASTIGSRQDLIRVVICSNSHCPLRQLLLKAHGWLQTL